MVRRKTLTLVFVGSNPTTAVCEITHILDLLNPHTANGRVKGHQCPVRDASQVATAIEGKLAVLFPRRKNMPVRETAHLLNRRKIE